MSLSIFGIDGINSEITDEKEIKTFVKHCGYESSFEVEIGKPSEELHDDDAVVNFCLKGINDGAD